MDREDIKEIAKELLFMPRNELIKLLISIQQENNQLKEQRQELRSWLEEIIPYLKVHGIRTTPDKVLEDVLNKLNVLEGKNE